MVGSFSDEQGDLSELKERLSGLPDNSNIKFNGYEFKADPNGKVTISEDKNSWGLDDEWETEGDTPLKTQSELQEDFEEAGVERQQTYDHETAVEALARKRLRTMGINQPSEKEISDQMFLINAGYAGGKRRTRTTRRYK